MISHTALAPKAHWPTNMPAMATPMNMWDTSTSRPAGRWVTAPRSNRTSAIGGNAQHKHTEQVIQPIRCRHRHDVKPPWSRRSGSGGAPRPECSGGRSTASRSRRSGRPTGPAFGSVAPPARIPPKFCTATQITAKTTIATTMVAWAIRGVMNTPAATARQTMAQQYRRRRPIVEEERFGGPVDTGQPPGLSGVHAGHEIVECPWRTARADDRQDCQQCPRRPPTWPWPPPPPPCGPPRTACPTLAWPQENGQNGVEQHAARTTAERGAPPGEIRPQSLTEPPHADGPDDRERQCGLAGSFEDDPEGDQELNTEQRARRSGRAGD